MTATDWGSRCMPWLGLVPLVWFRTLWLSLRYRLTLTIAWSAPGAAVLVGACAVDGRLVGRGRNVLACRRCATAVSVPRSAAWPHTRCRWRRSC
ncbi:hypothetical protein DIJ64_01680 [Mycobacterium leprae]|uniref:Uncharacterized protein n=1 Tax=Mycobacterium leprae TaxID=1769 RepID=A0AAD0P769_MYCLR|nr:hypothetical protein DIJ64_01680 [Mycobacterium leprae]